MDRVTTEGLRVHFVAKGQTETGEVQLGNIYEAVCGEVWKPTITDPQELAELPLCYDCVNYHAQTLLADYLLFQTLLNEYDLGVNDDSDN